MRYLWILLMMVSLGIAFCQEESHQQNEQQTEPETEAPDPSQEQANAQQNEIHPLDVFYGNRGFDLTPQTQALQWTNKVSTSFYYDSNVFLNEGDDRQDDLVSAIQLQTDLRYVQPNWQLGITGIFRYEDYFEENSLDQFLPQASIDFNWKGSMFYFSFKNETSRNTVPNSADLNDRNPWVQNRVQAVAGMEYKQLTLEVLSFHSYLDFRSIDGDYHNYGQSYLLKYLLRQNVTLLFEAAWDYINYREAIIIAGEAQNDTLGIRILPGIEVAFSKNLYLLVQAGVDHRAVEDYAAIKAFLTWQPTQSTRLVASALRQALPGFAGDFQLVTGVNFGAEFLLATNMVVKLDAGIFHSNPENGATSYRYDTGFTFVYRIMDGVELEAFCDLSIKDDSNADFTWLKTGGSINVIF